ncbi:MAG TPA: peptidylprolyl isomerase, partial [Candidatus Krumholzibacteria bacterium]|nr:peptidylprolyl isomerase [Candidatus Krumholzibacteria bacterium]
MKQLVAAAALAALIAGAAGAQTTKKELPVVVFETTKGNIEIELYPDKAPVTVQNFLYYVDN